MKINKHIFNLFNKNMLMDKLKNDNVLCGLCFIKINTKNKNLKNIKNIKNKCEICWTQIHSKCINKYQCDLSNATKCYDCGGSVIETICCETKISLDYLSGQTIQFFDISNNNNLDNDYIILEDISKNNLDYKKIKDYTLDLNNLNNFNEKNYYEKKYIKSPEFVMNENTLDIYCIHCIWNNKLFTFDQNKYSNIKINLLKNNFNPKLNDNIISTFTNLPYRD